MPHLIVEYSANVESRLSIDGLLDELYDVALDTGVFPLGGIRVRAHRTDRYRIADCDEANGFVHVTVWLGHGRPLDVRRRVGERLFEALCGYLSEAQTSSPLAISLNLQEFHPELNFKKNNLHQYVKLRAAGSEP